MNPGTLITDVDSGKITIHFVFLGSARGTVVTDFYWGTLVNDADFGKQTIH